MILKNIDENSAEKSKKYTAENSLENSVEKNAENTIWDNQKRA